MATTKKSKHVIGKVPMPEPMGKEPITCFESMAIATTDQGLADVWQFFVLPACCLPVGYTVGLTDMDTGTPAMTVHFGLLDAAGTAISTVAADGGAAWLTSLAASGAAAITSDTTTKAAYDILKAVTVSTVDRIVAFVVAVIPATAAAGTASLQFSYKAAN